MGVRGRDARQPVIVRELGRADISVAEHESGVPGFHVVDLREDRLELSLPALPPSAGTEAVEGVRQADQAALLVYRAGGIERRSSRCDGVRQVEADEIAR